MSTSLTVIARLKARSGREEALEQALRALVAPTRDEPGCRIYDLHRSHEDPGLFYFYESWESRALWDDHMKSPHLAAFSDRQSELAQSWELFVGEKISAEV